MVYYRARHPFDRFATEGARRFIRHNRNSLVGGAIVGRSGRSGRSSAGQLKYTRAPGKVK
jgi:hypothetical protein